MLHLFSIVCHLWPPSGILSLDIIVFTLLIKESQSIFIHKYSFFMHCCCISVRQIRIIPSLARKRFQTDETCRENGHVYNFSFQL